MNLIQVLINKTFTLFQVSSSSSPVPPFLSPPPQRLPGRRQAPPVPSRTHPLPPGEREQFIRIGDLEYPLCLSIIPGTLQSSL